MPGDMDNLNTGSALLLMYIADELSPKDRADFETRLLTDAPLAAELARLRAADASFVSAMKALDFGQPPATSDTAAAERANRAVRLWVTTRQARPKTVPRKEHLLPWGSYPLGAGGGILVVIVFWGLHSWEGQNVLPGTGNTPETSTVAQDDAQDEESSSPVAPTALSELTGEQQQALLDAFDAGDSGQVAESTQSGGLDEADGTIAALQNTSDADNLLLDSAGKAEQRT